jgi:hypothetical protein
VARGHRVLNADHADHADHAEYAEYAEYAGHASYADHADTVRCVCPDVGVCLPSVGGFAPDV